MNKKFFTALFVSAAILFNLAMVVTTSNNGDITLSKLSQAFAQSANENDSDDDASQPGDNSNDVTCNGSVAENVTVHCSRTSNGDTTASAEGEVHGDINQSWGMGSASAGGSAGGSTSSSSSDVVTGTWDATGINCIPRYSPDVCVSHYPC